MSKANAKASTPTAQEDVAPPAQEAAAAADTPEPAVVPATAPATQDTPAAPAAPAPDEYHGHGGLYTMHGGKRVLVANTRPEATEETP